MDVAFWNNRYAAPHFVYGETPNAFVAEMASQIPASPALCLAEGEGRNAVHLATLGRRVVRVVAGHCFGSLEFGSAGWPALTISIITSG